MGLSSSEAAKRYAGHHGKLGQPFAEVLGALDAEILDLQPRLKTWPPTIETDRGDHGLLHTGHAKHAQQGVPGIEAFDQKDASPGASVGPAHCLAGCH